MGLAAHTVGLVAHTIGLAAHTMGLVAHTIGLAALLGDGLVWEFLVMFGQSEWNLYLWWILHIFYDEFKSMNVKNSDDFSGTIRKDIFNIYSKTGEDNSKFDKVVKFCSVLWSLALSWNELSIVDVGVRCDSIMTDTRTEWVFYTVKPLHSMDLF
jgi:hypothetical protein